MTVAFVKHHLGDGHKTSNTTLNPAAVLDSNVPAGRVLVLGVALSSQSLTTPTITALTKPAGETASWVLLKNVGSSSATVNASVLGELWAIKTTQQWDAGYNIDVTTSIATAGKVGVLSEFSGVDVVQVSTAGAGAAATIGASASTTGLEPPDGALVLGLAVHESTPSNTTDDTDTLNGSWSAGNMFGTTGGINVNLNVTANLQYKILTAPGHQTFNMTGSGSNDSGAIIAALQETPINGMPIFAGISAQDPGADTTSTPAVPGGVGDFMLIPMWTAQNANQSVPSGFTQKFSDISANMTAALHYKTNAGSDAGTYTVPTATLPATYWNNALAVRFANIGAIFSSHAIAAQSTSPGSPANLSLNDVPANSILVWIALTNAAGSSTTLTTLPSGSTMSKISRRTPNSSLMTHVVTGIHNKGGSGVSNTGNIGGAVIGGSASFYRVVLVALTPIVAMPENIIGGVKKNASGLYVVQGGSKKAVSAISEIIGGNKKSMI